MDTITTHDLENIDRANEEKGLKGAVLNKDWQPGVDLRRVKCSCGKPECRIGLNFDFDTDNNRAILRLTDRFSEETTMYADRSTIDEIIDNLRDLKKSIKNPKK